MNERFFKENNLIRIFSIINYLILLAAIIIFIIFMMSLSGCERNPVNRLVNPTLSNTTSNWGDEWIIYDDEIKTNGTVMMFTTMEGQELDFSSRENPKQGSKCIKYSWNGDDTTTYDTPPKTQHDYVGFSLIVADDFNNYNSTTKDFTQAGYTKLSFWARGSLYDNVYLRLETYNGKYDTASGNNAWMSNMSDRQVTDSWQKYEFTVSGDMSSIKDFVRIVIKYDEDGNPYTINTGRGNGGTVFIDDIRLTK